MKVLESEKRKEEREKGRKTARKKLKDREV